MSPSLTWQTASHIHDSSSLLEINEEFEQVVMLIQQRMSVMSGGKVRGSSVKRQVW